MSDPSTTCPNCGYDSVDVRIEDDRVVHFCENCGWCKVSHHPFRIGVWSVRIRQALAPIDVLQSLLTNKDIVKFLRPRLKGVSHLSSPIPNFDLGDDYFRGEIEISHKVYLGQMFVLVMTYTELMIRDFDCCLFLEQPQRMNSVLSHNEKGKAIVYLNEILEAGSREELLERLAERASAKVAGRKVDDSLSRLIRDCGLDLKHPIVEDFKTLNEQRNRIVHEGKLDDIDVQKVLNGYEQLLYLLYVLSEATIKYGVSFIDEVDFVYNFREQLKHSQMIEQH